MSNFVKFVLNELKPYKWTVVFCAFLAIIAALMEMAAPILMGRGFDLAGKGQPFLIYGGALAAWFIIRFLAARLRNRVSYLGTSLGDEIGMKYMARMMGEIMDKPLSFHYGKKSNETANKISFFRWNFTSVIEGLFSFIPAVLAIIAIITYLSYVDWRIGLVMGLGVALFLAYVFSISRVWVKKRDHNNGMSRKVEQTGWDSLRNVLVVKSTSNESFFRRTLGRLRREWIDCDKDVVNFEKRMTNVQDAIVAVTTFVAVSLSVYNLSAGRFTLGQLSSVVAFTFSIFGYITFLQWQVRWMLKSIADYITLNKLMAEPAEDFSTGNNKVLGGGVEFKNIAFGYQKDRPILRDVSFAVAPGERIAVVGESGEGKTTLVDLLGRYYPPNAGEILFDGVPAADINLKSLRSQMAYVPQDLTLFHESLEFNIRYGRPEAKDREIKLAAEEAHLTEFVKRLPKGMKTKVGERGLKLSGGERQRVALARAFLRNPKILVLDEPTAHLDSKTENFIQEALKKLMLGRTTFIIAHRLRTVKTADKILVLQNGRIVEVGRHEDLIKNPRSVYVALLKAQGGYLSPNETHLK